MSEHQTKKEVETAIKNYFELMYDCDVSRFDNVFRDTAQLHGFRQGQMTMWSAAKYKQILSERQSPKSTDAKREEEVLMIDVASDTQALAKVKVRIGAAVFIDYLSYHKIDGQWLITSKAYHLVQ